MFEFRIPTRATVVPGSPDWLGFYDDRGALRIFDTRRSKALSYPDHVGVVAFFHCSQRSIGARAVLDTKDQFGIRQAGEGKREIEAQIEEHLGAALMNDLMLTFLSNWIGNETQPKYKAWRNLDRIEQGEATGTK